MQKYNPHIHHRRSIRLKGYDYSQAGLYFITICCQDWVHRFGTIENGEMILNPAGKMIEKWYYELENKYPDKRCHEMVVMPNHFHCIIENTKMPAVLDAHVGTSLRGCPITNERGRPNVNKNGHSKTNKNVGSVINEQYGLHNTKHDAIIGDAINWFKTMTTNEYIRGVKKLGWEPFNGKIWQRNYYERIAAYIINNPAKWENDKFYND